MVAPAKPALETEELKSRNRAAEPPLGQRQEL